MGREIICKLTISFYPKLTEAIIEDVLTILESNNVSHYYFEHDETDIWFEISGRNDIDYDFLEKVKKLPGIANITGGEYEECDNIYYWDNETVNKDE